jgi:toxin-antitoxin system PIN domain toxin
MSRYLLDVNVLLALVWPRHVGYSTAHVWFAKTGHKAWATNPLTQLGVLRLLTNPAITQGVVSPRSAWDAVHEATRHPGHEFWPMKSEPAISMKDIAGRLHGHQQWADASLLVHAIEHSGVLVTFDAGIAAFAKHEAQGQVVLLKQSGATR